MVSDSREKRTNGIASTVKYLTETEIRAILSVLHDGENRLMFLLGLDLGARVSEIAGLRWDCINWPNRFVTVRDNKKSTRAKTDIYRNCTISKASWDMLKERRKAVDERKDKLVFPMSHKTFNRRIKAWALEAGVDRRVRWHTLRHTYVVQSRRVGRDWNEISQQTGDTLGTLVKEYGSLSIEDRVTLTDSKPLIEGLNGDD